jgi:hypothetical protein
MFGGVLVGRGSFGKWLVTECEDFFSPRMDANGREFF